MVLIAIPLGLLTVAFVYWAWRYEIWAENFKQDHHPWNWRVLVSYSRYVDWLVARYVTTLLEKIGDGNSSSG